MESEIVAAVTVLGGVLGASLTKAIEALAKRRSDRSERPPPMPASKSSSMGLRRADIQIEQMHAILTATDGPGGSLLVYNKPKVERAIMQTALSSQRIEQHLEFLCRAQDPTYEYRQRMPTNPGE